MRNNEYQISLAISTSVIHALSHGIDDLTIAGRVHNAMSDVVSVGEAVRDAVEEIIHLQNIKETTTW